MLYRVYSPSPLLYTCGQVSRFVPDSSFRRRQIVRGPLRCRRHRPHRSICISVILSVFSFISSFFTYFIYVILTLSLYPSAVCTSPNIYSFLLHDVVMSYSLFCPRQSDDKRRHHQLAIPPDQWRCIVSTNFSSISLPYFPFLHLCFPCRADVKTNGAEHNERTRRAYIYIRRAAKYRALADDITRV